MELIEVMRQAAIDMVMRQMGQSRHDPRQNVAQKGAASNEAIIMGFPIDYSNQLPLQVQEPGSDFGKFYFMPNYDLPNNGTIIR